MPWIAAGIAVSGIAGSLIGGGAQKKAAKQQQEMIAAATARAQQIIDEIGAPPDLSQAIVLDQLQQVGVLTPEIEQFIKSATPEVSKIQEDRNLRNTQVKVLKQLSDRGKAGLTPEERAEFNIARQAVQRDLTGKEEQIKQDLAMRGQAGGGAEIAARLLTSQESADRASEEADRISSLASMRALEAIGQEAALAGSVRGQDFDVERTKASALDEFERFNVTNQMGINQRNVDRQNIAQEANLQERQRVADFNVQQANAERYRQAEAKRQHWLDKLAQAQAKSNIIVGGASGQAQAIGNIGQANANMASGISQGLIGGLSAFQGQQNADRRYDLLKNYYSTNNTAPIQGNSTIALDPNKYRGVV